MKNYKKDILVVLILLVITVGIFFVLRFIHRKPADVVEIYREDTLIETYSFNDNGQYEIKNGDDINQIVIEDGEVFIREANCPDKLCVKQGSISKSGESIICLPHKIVVKVSSKEGK